MQQLEAVRARVAPWMGPKPSAEGKKKITCMYKRSYICKGHLQTEKGTLKHITVIGGGKKEGSGA